MNNESNQMKSVIIKPTIIILTHRSNNITITKSPLQTINNQITIEIIINNLQKYFILQSFTPMLSLNPTPIDTQIGRLLAFIILFEKKIEQLRIKLAGNEEFHSRLAFQLIDSRRKSAVSAQDLTDVINRYKSVKGIEEVEAFCRKYTANGCFSYDEFIKFFTPKTNKVLAQRLMIRTYRQGTTLPNNVISLLLETFATAITMTSLTQNLRKQLHATTELTHLQVLELFRKCCTSREKLFYFINASTNGEGDYDFAIEEMDFLAFHVRGNCELEDITDQQIKQILCPLDMNYQKNINKTMSTFGKTMCSQNKTEYFKTKNSFLTGKTNENEQPFRKTVNFLRTNYQQTSKNFYQPGGQRPKAKIQSKEMFFEPLDENVQTRPPTPMMNQKNFPGFTPYLVLDHYNLQSKPQPMPSHPTSQPNDTSQISSINYGNLYIQKFTRGHVQNPSHAIGYSKKLNFNKNESQSRTQLDNMLIEKMQHEKKKEMFFDEFNSRRYGYPEDSDVSGESAFLQY